MAVGKDGQAKAIAASWGVDVSLLEDAEWEVESIDGNDGEVYGYVVRFNDESDRDVLAELGVEPGETTRRLSLNAFDEPEYTDEDYERDLRIREGIEDEPSSVNADDDGTSPIDRPFPDISTVIDDFELTEPFERPDDGQRSYTLEDRRIFPSDFSELDRALKIETMVQWFHENYEDPAVRTPYESAEGGYQWIWGGPYDAREEIGDQFSDIADDDEIEAAIQEVEKDGLVDWAPTESPDDYDQPEEVDDEPPPAGSLAAIMGSNFGNTNFSNFTFEPGVAPRTKGQDGAVEALKSEMLDRLDGLEALIRQQMSIAPNRGHNHPPELLELDPPVTQAQFQELVIAIAEVRQESESPAPQLVKVVERVTLFRRIADFIKTGPGLVLGAAVSGVIGDTAADAFKAHQHQIYESLVHAADAVMAWVNYLVPF